MICNQRVGRSSLSGGTISFIENERFLAPSLKTWRWCSGDIPDHLRTPGIERPGYCFRCSRCSKDGGTARPRVPPAAAAVARPAPPGGRVGPPMGPPRGMSPPQPRELKGQYIRHAWVDVAWRHLQWDTSTPARLLDTYWRWLALKLGPSCLTELSLKAVSGKPVRPKYQMHRGRVSNSAAALKRANLSVRRAAARGCRMRPCQSSLQRNDRPRRTP